MQNETIIYALHFYKTRDPSVYLWYDQGYQWQVVVQHHLICVHIMVIRRPLLIRNTHSATRTFSDFQVRFEPRIKDIEHLSDKPLIVGCVDLYSTLIRYVMACGVKSVNGNYMVNLTCSRFIM